MFVREVSVICQFEPVRISLIDTFSELAVAKTRDSEPGCCQYGEVAVSWCLCCKLLPSTLRRSMPQQRPGMPAYSVSLRMHHTLTTAAVFIAEIAAVVAYFCARPARPEGQLPVPQVAFL